MLKANYLRTYKTKRKGASYSTYNIKDTKGDIYKSKI